MAETRNELVLAQNQHAFIQDETKGTVQVIVGPFKTGLTVSDRPVIFDSKQNKFVNTSLENAVSQNPTVPEDSYVVLVNPASNGQSEQLFPTIGSQAPVTLKNGRKVNIPGPVTFALWPGQVATVISGHQLKSNEYIAVRIYNVEESDKNWPSDALSKPEALVVGQTLIIKGTDVSFFIPPTGMEIVKDPMTGEYVRKAVTLEQLEYCILLDEDGTKRYERGPKVVFPEATEKFLMRKSGSATDQAGPTDTLTKIKFKAIELNDQMGLYIKVIEDYEEDGKIYKTGDELFITGKTQRIYYPRKEHAVIEYGSESADFKRQRYYGIAIPKGEARYVLNKDTGRIEMVKGETLFLPDPRHQTIVKRVLDSKTVKLWYPGNVEALAYNESLNQMAESTQNYVTMASYDASLAGALDTSRSINRTTSNSIQSKQSSLVGDTLRRGTQFTPPPSVTLNTKYDGPPIINIWTGYAVQVVSKSGSRRVVKGPATVLLEYDETLEELVLSTGNPKNADNLKHDVYLRVDHNKVSDTIEVETKDMVTALIKVSYRVNFEGDSEKWFAVENYVKFMCDHVRSILRGVAKKLSIKELIDHLSDVVRDSVLGAKDSKNKIRPGHRFEENGMRIYDVEVLKFQITSKDVAEMIQEAQKTAVSNTLLLTQKQQDLENARVIQKLELEIEELKNQTALRKIELDKSKVSSENQARLTRIAEESQANAARQEGAIKLAELLSIEEKEKLAIKEAKDKQIIEMAKEETELFTKRMGSVNDKLAQALENLAESNMLSEVASAVAPLAIMEQQGIGPVIERVFGGSNLLEKFQPLSTNS